MKYPILFLLTLATGYAQDCMPNTFTYLSRAVGNPVTAWTWRDQFFPKKDMVAPTLREGLNIWHKNIPGVDLIRIKEDDPILFDTPYLWIGHAAQELVVDPGSSLEHSALAYFHPTRVSIINIVSVIDVEGQEVFIWVHEQITYKEFFKRTIIVYRVSLKNPREFTPMYDILKTQKPD